MILLQLLGRFGECELNRGEIPMHVGPLEERKCAGWCRVAKEGESGLCCLSVFHAKTSVWEHGAMEFNSHYAIDDVRFDERWSIRLYIEVKAKCHRGVQDCHNFFVNGS